MREFRSMIYCGSLSGEICIFNLSNGKMNKTVPAGSTMVIIAPWGAIITLASLKLLKLLLVVLA